MTFYRWIDEARRVGLDQVAGELAWPIRGRRITCPGCSTSDACKVLGERWRCFRCGVHGDAIDLVAHAVSGQALQAGCVAEVRAWYASRGWCRSDEGAEPVVRRAVPVRPVEPVVELGYPPVHELEQLEELVEPFELCTVATAWVARRFGAASVPALGRSGVFHVLGLGALPAWAAVGKRSWLDAGYRGLLWAYDASGCRRSCRVRALADLPWEGAPKALPPRGYSVRGLVLASKRGRRMLAGLDAPELVVVAEGEPQFMAAVIAWPKAAVLGIVSGSWTPEIAARVPFGARVLVVADHDEAGDRYAEQVEQTLTGRAYVARHMRTLGAV
jgi:hypothetical protein